jgi:EmrB/QacA subfamily drug resistance transporter
MTTTGPHRTTRRYLRPPWMARHVGNRLAPLFRRGMIWHLSVAGRRSSRVHEVPMVLLEAGGERYLVAARGHTDWALNLAAARRAQLRHGHTAEEITVAEVPARDRRPLIDAYVQRYGRMPTVARTFRALPDPADHPVFRIVSTRAPGEPGGPDQGEGGSQRWLALACIALAQLMVALDATVMNIALPSAQHALHATDAERQWVVTAYTLAFGGLLLPGGRLADTLGRRRTFLIGLAGFAAASAVGGAAPSLIALLAARAAQGTFAALLTPTALSLLAITFTEPRERAKAFAVFGSIVGTGGAVGLLLGGTLTQYASWRWCLYINVVIALVAWTLGRRILPPVPRARGGIHLDVPGAALVTGGLVALVYGLSQAAAHGWSATAPLTWLAVGIALLAAFLAAESRVNHPLVPLRILADRNRGGSCLAIGLTVVAMYGVFLLLTYDFQMVMHYSPARAGVAFLPLSAASLLSSNTVSRALLPKVPPRALMAPGLVLAAAGMATLALLQAHSGYVSVVLPGEVMLGLGIGAVFVPAFSVATTGVSPRDAGVASAVANTAQQVGASLGTALLNSLAAAATVTYLASHAHPQGPAALVHGYSVAAAWAAGILAFAALMVAALINAPRPQQRRAR